MTDTPTLVEHARGLITAWRGVDVDAVALCADQLERVLLLAVSSEAPQEELNKPPKRDIPALIEALRIRALALTGAEWERTATRDMMKEAADRLEESQARLSALEGPMKELKARIDFLDRCSDWDGAPMDRLIDAVRTLVAAAPPKEPTP